MPELSEVEQYRTLLLPLVCANETSCPNTCLIECPSPTPPKFFPQIDELTSLKAYRVTDVRRKGKLLRVDLECTKKSTRKTQQERLFLFLHMGMTGRISTPNKVPGLESLPDNDSYPPPHTHLIIKSNGHEAAFSDPRRFGKVCLCSPSDNQFNDLAPDAMDEPGTLDGIVGQRKGIKAILLDQKAVVSGVGNWIADEVLYQSALHPDQTYLTTAERDAVRDKLHYILTTAVKCLKEGKDFPEDWIFHRRWKKSASKGATIKDAKGRKISWLQSGGRSSAVVLSVQKQKSTKMREAKLKEGNCSAGKEQSHPGLSPSDDGRKTADSRKKKRKVTTNNAAHSKSTVRRSNRREVV